MERVAGVDVAYRDSRYWSALVIFVDGRFDRIEEDAGLSYDPYISTLFFLKEAPLISRLIYGRHIDLLFVNGHGICHPYRYGLATVVGVTSKVRTIGVARRLIRGEYERVATPCTVIDLITQRGFVLGAAIRRTPQAAELFLSPGYGLTVPEAVAEYLTWARVGKVPEPLRLAHIHARKMRREGGQAQGGAKDPRLLAASVDKPT